MLDGVAVGLPVGELVGCVDGDDVVLAIGLPVLRPEKTLIPTIPSSSTMITATAAGTSHGGRSARIPPPPAGGRATDGLRTGGGVVIRDGGAGVG